MLTLSLAEFIIVAICIYLMGVGGKMAGNLWTESKLEACMSLFALNSPSITAFLRAGPRSDGH